MDRPVGLISRPFWRKESSPDSGLELRTTVGLLLVLILFTVIEWLYLDQEATITAVRAEIAQLEEERSMLLQKSRDLQVRIARQTAMNRIKPRAEASGLHPPEQITKLWVTPVGRPARSETTADPAQFLAQVYGDTANLEIPWWRSLVMRLENWIGAVESSG